MRKTTATLDEVHTMVQRLNRRTSNAVRAIYTPYPISNASIGDDVRGSILKYLFPCKGKITKGMVYLDKEYEDTQVTISIFSEEGISRAHSYKIERDDSVNIDMDLSAGDRVDVSLSGKDPVKECWISFLWIPTISDIETKKFLFDEIEKDTQE